MAPNSARISSGVAASFVSLAFRDDSPFEALQHKALPELIDAKAKTAGQFIFTTLIQEATAISFTPAVKPMFPAYGSIPAHGK